MSFKLDSFAYKKRTQHSPKSTQYTFEHCPRLWCFKDGKIVWFCIRGYRTKTVRKIFFKIKYYFTKKKKISSNISYAQA